MRVHEPDCACEECASERKQAEAFLDTKTLRHMILNRWGGLVSERARKRLLEQAIYEVVRAVVARRRASESGSVAASAAQACPDCGGKLWSRDGTQMCFKCKAVKGTALPSGAKDAQPAIALCKEIYANTKCVDSEACRYEAVIYMKTYDRLAGIAKQQAGT